VSLIPQYYERIKRQLSAGEGSLKGKVFRGGAWLGAGSFIEQLVRFGRSIILARLLAPEAFGIMAVVLSASTLIHSLTDIGVREAVIQNPRGAEDEYIDSAFWLALGRAFALAACIFLVAPWMAKFYGNAELTPLLRVAALSVLIDGAWSPRMYIAIKQLKFSRLAAIMHGGGIGGVIFTVILSYFIRDVWALVIGAAVESLARVSLSYVFYPYFPKSGWHREATRDLLRFSRGLFGLSLLNLIFAKTDIFVLAKLFPPAQLGLYSMAVYLAQTPTGFVMNLLGQTMMPTFAHIQGDEERENRILLRVTSMIFVLGMPLILFVYFCGRSVLDLAFGGRYSAAAPALVAAAVVSVLGLANGQVTTVFYARGLPQLHRVCVIIMAGTMIALIYPSAKYFGLLGGQLASVAACVAGWLFQIARIRQITHLSIGRYFGSFFLAVAISGAVIVACVGQRLAGVGSGPIATIAFGVVGCAVAYGLAGAFFLRESAQAA
jgi:lipopolysaccharide exporter